MGNGNNRIILGVSGASGVIISWYLAKALKAQGLELHMVVTDAAKLTWEYEVEPFGYIPGKMPKNADSESKASPENAIQRNICEESEAVSENAVLRNICANCDGKAKIEMLADLADVLYDSKDMAAAISSGSFCTMGMIVVPCSMKTLAGIVTGYTDNLLLRAADVCLKENRRIVLCPREMPLGKVHLRNMSTAADLGCTIVPPMLSFYSGQMTVQDQIQHVVGKILMQFGLEYEEFHPWDGCFATDQRESRKAKV